MNLTKHLKKLILDRFKDGYAIVDIGYIYPNGTKPRTVAQIEDVLREALIERDAALDKQINKQVMDAAQILLGKDG